MQTYDTNHKELLPRPDKLPLAPAKVQKQKKDLSKFRAEATEAADVTTLMIRGLPCSFTQEMLMHFLDQNAGLAGKYDFFYLPRAGVSSYNLGYAFVNFVEPAQAAACRAAMDGVQLDPSRSSKICKISPADVQGLQNLRQHFHRTSVRRGTRGPLFLKVGENTK